MKKELFDIRSNKKKIVDYLFTSENKLKGFCDDCISSILNIRPRQQVNQICHILKDEGIISRVQFKCALCKKVKILNFAEENE